MCGNIWICSRKDMAAIVENTPNFFNLLMIRGPDEHKFEQIVDNVYLRNRAKDLCDNAEKGIKFAKSHEILYFDDYVKPTIGRTLATKEDINKALKFAEGKDDIIVACAAGISRSSAIAYTIARTRASKEEALKIIDINKHWPNRHIISLAEEILKLPLAQELNELGFNNGGKN